MTLYDDDPVGLHETGLEIERILGHELSPYDETIVRLGYLRGLNHALQDRIADKQKELDRLNRLLKVAQP